MKSPIRSSIEMLEDRIAPAAILSFTDSDGDLVTVKASKGTNAQLASAVLRDMSGNILSITLPTSIYEGSDFSIVANLAPGGHGDGRIAVPMINAVGTDLGVVSIDGDVGAASIGPGTTGVPAVKSFTALSIGLNNTALASTYFDGAVPSISVAGDIGPLGDIHIVGNLATAHIGGSLEGAATSNGGNFIVIGDAATIVVKGAVIGGSASDTGELGVTGGVTATNVSVGSLIGGSAQDSGVIIATGNFGTVTVARDIVAGTGVVSGSIMTTQNIGSVTVDGSIEGNFTSTHLIGAGVNLNTGLLTTSGTLGSVTVKGSVGENGAYVIDAHDKVGNITIGGDATSLGVFSGGTIGNVKTGGDLLFSSISAHGTGTGAAIAGVAVGGNSHLATIDAGAAVLTAQTVDPNAVLGSVSIAGEAVGVNIDGGTAAGTSSKISSVKIGGQAINVNVVSNWIVSASVDGLKVPLLAGANNDSSVTYGGLFLNEV